MNVSIVGTGSMGAALARTLLAGGVNVTVWNRSLDKARALEPVGASVASDLPSALIANPATIICIDNYAATRALLDERGVARSLAGRSILQFSTGTPAEASEADKWMRAQGAAYLEGAIMVYPGDIGTDRAQMLISGPRDQFDKWEPALRLLSADLRYVGAAIQAAAAIDMALLSRLIGLKFGAIYGAHICEAEGIDVSHLAELMKDGDPARVSASVIASGDFRLGSGSASCDVALGVVSRIQMTAHAAGLNSELPDLLVKFYKRTIEAGFGAEDSAAVIKAMRAARP